MSVVTLGFVDTKLTPVFPIICGDDIPLQQLAQGPTAEVSSTGMSGFNTQMASDGTQDSSCGAAATPTAATKSEIKAKMGFI